MERKTCVMPMTLVQKFEANETVSACWGVACNVDDANAWEKENNWWEWAFSGVKHRKDHCGALGNQVIYDDNNDGIADRMIEIGVEEEGTLQCVIYADSGCSSDRTRPVSDVKIGEYLYWGTWSDSTHHWHHQGTVVASDPKHPNRS